jgi:hypothetical protein
MTAIAIPTDAMKTSVAGKVSTNGVDSGEGVDASEFAGEGGLLLRPLSVLKLMEIEYAVHH